MDIKKTNFEKKIDLLKEDVSHFIEVYNSTYHYDNIMTSIIDIIKNNEFEFIDYSNINQFLTSELKEKLFYEASQNKYIKSEFALEKGLF